MKTEPIAEDESTTYSLEPMLLDCYMELFAYTGYVGARRKDGVCGPGGDIQVFEQLVQRSRRFAESAGFTENQWLEGLFPVCAYIDECMICAIDGGSAEWEKNQLQRKYFNTTAAGWEFYERLDSLNAASSAIRAVYEFCLALGFKGQYFRSSDRARIEDIRYAQLKEVAGATGLDYPETMFPEAYEPEDTASKRTRRRRQRFSLALVAAVMLPVFFFAVFYLFFDRLLDQTLVRYFGTGF